MAVFPVFPGFQFFFSLLYKPCEKCYRKSNKKSKFREQRYAYLSDLWPTISQQRAQSLDGREKSDAHFRYGVRRPCKLIEKVDRPANSRDASPIGTIWSIVHETTYYKDPSPKTQDKLRQLLRFAWKKCYFTGCPKSSFLHFISL